MPHIIRTSDRIAFKKCRQQWNWSSKIRSDLEPNRSDFNLTFGTAIHRGLEHYYDPRLWNDVQAREALAIVEFVGALPKPPQDADPEQEAAYCEAVDLGKGMLCNYFAWARKHDHFTPKYVEIEFEVPIPVPHDLTYLPEGFSIYVIDGREYLDYQDEPIVYQGRIDLIVEDDWGALWIADHKTAGKFYDTEFLQLDEQCSSYAWAIQEMLGIRVEGVLYNELRKTLPHPPKQLKSGKFSTDKSQETTYDLYVETLAQHGEDVLGYEPFLSWLQENEKPYFRRTQVHRSQRELALVGHRIAYEAIDMLNAPSIYPSPDRFTCGRCAFKTPCLALMDGSDHAWMLNELFHRRTETPTTTSP